MSVRLPSGHLAEDVKGEEFDQLKKHFSRHREGLIRLNPGRWLLPAKFKQLADNYFNFKFRATDVLVMTFPKSGTTWMQEIIWTMRNNPDLNNLLATSTTSFTRCPVFESDLLSAGKTVQLLESKMQEEEEEEEEDVSEPKEILDDFCLKLSENCPDPRTLRTHFPFSFLNPHLLDTAKVVYMLRDPKDVCISFHHHCRVSKSLNYTGSFDEYFQYFINDQVIFSPYWNHVEDAWTKRNHPNLHLVFYEDLKADVMGELRKLNTFLNTNLSEQQLQNVAHFTGFNQMKTRWEEGELSKVSDVFNSDVQKTDGGFFRKGEVGDGKRLMSELQQEKINLWISEHNSKLQVPFK